MSPGRAHGFTLLELLVTLTVFTILTVAAVPNFRSWISNSKVRSVADGIEGGLRQAQAEAARDSRRVDFSLTNMIFPAGTPGATVLAGAAVATGGLASGTNWAITTEPLLSGESSVYVAGSNISSVASGITVTGPSTTTFNSIGAVTTATVGTLVTYTISSAYATHPLDVTVSASGQIRVCDPTRSMSTSPDGCPP